MPIWGEGHGGTGNRGLFRTVRLPVGRTRERIHVYRCMLLAGLLLFGPFHRLPAETTEVVKVACVGDSITQGYGTANRPVDAYPFQLQRMLGGNWKVGNFGVSGRTLLNSGDHPYQTKGMLAEALAFNPGVVVIMLGTNDTKPHNWEGKDRFVEDYRELVGKFKALPSQPKIYICYPPFVAGEGKYGIDESRVQELMPMIDRVAGEERIGIIDMHSVLKEVPGVLPDCVHPSTAGARLLALQVFKTLTGKEFTEEVSLGSGAGNPSNPTN